MYNKSMLVFGLVFLVLLGGIFYVGTERAKLDTAPVVKTESTDYSVTPAASSTPDESVNEQAPVFQGKIDVRVVCEGVLAYTTFADSASADAYVAECIEGKHPEVIERFINELGVDGATI